jgi:hypothetical protein
MAGVMEVAIAAAVVVVVMVELEGIVAFGSMLCCIEPTTGGASVTDPAVEGFFVLGADLVAIELIAPFLFDGLFETDPTPGFRPGIRCEVTIGRLTDGIVDKAVADGIIFNGVEEELPTTTPCCC